MMWLLITADYDKEETEWLALFSKQQYTIQADQDWHNYKVADKWHKIHLYP